MYKNMCWHHSQGERAMFARYCTDTTKCVLEAIQAYRQQFPRHELAHFKSEKPNDRSLTQDIIQMYSSMVNVEEILSGDNVVLSALPSELFTCPGTPMSKALTCVACQLSILFSDFDIVQTLVHLTQVVNSPNLSNLVEALFEQMTCLDISYTLNLTIEYETPVIMENLTICKLWRTTITRFTI